MFKRVKRIIAYIRTPSVGGERGAAAALMLLVLLLVSVIGADSSADFRLSATVRLRNTLPDAG